MRDFKVLSDAVDTQYAPDTTPARRPHKRRRITTRTTFRNSSKTLTDESELEQPPGVLDLRDGQREGGQQTWHAQRKMVGKIDPSQINAGVMTKLDMPVNRKQDYSDCPPAVAELGRRVKRFAHSIHGTVSPAALKRLRKRFPGQAPNLPDTLAVNTDPRLELGGDIDHGMLDFLLQSLEDCEADGIGARWQDSHQYPVLYAAKMTSVHPKHVLVQNVTQTQIDKIFRPVHGESGSILEGHCVDYTICLAGPSVFNEVVEHLEKIYDNRTYGRSVNFLDDLKLRFRPIAISIETRDYAPASLPVRLQVWAYAHFKFLIGLVTFAGWTDRDLPVLPLVLAEGQNWRLYVARCARSKAAKSGWEVDMYDLGQFAAVEGLREMLKCIVVLMVLIDHVQIHYRPWLESLFKRTIEMAGSVAR